MAKSGVPELAVNGTIVQYAEFGAGSTVVVSAQQEFGTPNFLERLEDAHVYAIRLRLVDDQVAGGEYDDGLGHTAESSSPPAILPRGGRSIKRLIPSPA